MFFEITHPNNLDLDDFPFFEISNDGDLAAHYIPPATTFYQLYEIQNKAESLNLHFDIIKPF